MNAIEARMPVTFRVYTLFFAVCLGILAAWLISSAAFRTPVPFFPRSKSEIENVLAQRDKAGLAASIGLFRGDLWADYALLVDNGLIDERPSSDTNDEARSTTERALAAAPYDARLWLLLSTMNARIPGKNDQTLAQLKMSYYTAPSETRLIPLRFQMAMQSRAIEDEELRLLVSHEISTIITHKPELKRVIATAYRNADANGRAFIENQLTADRAFLAEVKRGQR